MAIYRGARKGKQVASCTKWGLGENVVLRLIECLTPTVSFDMFMDNWFRSFRLLTHLGVNNIRTTDVFEQQVCSTKIGYANTLTLGANSCKKRIVDTLNSAAHISRKSIVTCVVD